MLAWNTHIAWSSLFHWGFHSTFCPTLRALLERKSVHFRVLIFGKFPRYPSLNSEPSSCLMPEGFLPREKICSVFFLIKREGCRDLRLAKEELKLCGFTDNELVPQVPHIAGILLQPTLRKRNRRCSDIKLYVRTFVFRHSFASD